MRTAFLIVLALTVFAQAAPAADDAAADRPAPAAVVADTPAAVPGSLLGSARVEVVRSLNAERQAGAWSSRTALPASRSSGSWVKRHPVWFGALIGAAVGTPIAYATWGAEGSFVGFWGGAAAGGVVGAIVGK